MQDIENITSENKEIVTKIQITQAEIKKNRSYENFPVIRELRQEMEDKEKKIVTFKDQIASLNSSEHVEKLSRVKELKEENEKLREQNQLLQHLSKKGGQEKGKEFE